MARSTSFSGSDFEKVTATSLVQNSFHDEFLYGKCLRSDVHSRTPRYMVMSSRHFGISKCLRPQEHSAPRRNLSPCLISGCLQ
jgi:hypothetical protein